MAAVDISPEKNNGVLKTVLREGTGDLHPPTGATVFVHYVGTLTDGEKFDSSRDRGDEFKFALGKEQVIKGWDIGVATMKKGELAEFVIAPELAYGASGSPPKIPGGATLKFEVELLRWESEDISPDRDGTITRDVIVKGESLANPNECSNVEVHAVGAFEGRVFYDRDLTFPLGEGSEQGLPEGVDRALRRMDKGEKSIVHIKGSKFTYGPNPPAEYNLPANAPIDFTLFLKSYEKLPNTWELSGEQKIEAAKVAKERGTHFLKEGKLRLALNKYKRVEDLLEYEKATGELKEQRDALMLAAFLNKALVYQKMTEYGNGDKECSKALEMDPKNVKALYRKGQCQLAMNEPEEARKLFEQCVEIEPTNKAAQLEIQKCIVRVRENLEKQKRRYKGMFSKLATDDTEPDVVTIPDDDQEPSTSGVEVPTPMETETQA